MCFCCHDRLYWDRGSSIASIGWIVWCSCKSWMSGSMPVWASLWLHPSLLVCVTWIMRVLLWYQIWSKQTKALHNLHEPSQMGPYCIAQTPEAFGHLAFACYFVMLACVTWFMCFSTCASRPFHLNVWAIEFMVQVTSGWHKLVWYQSMIHVWRQGGTHTLPLVVYTFVLSMVVTMISMAFDGWGPVVFYWGSVLLGFFPWRTGNLGCPCDLACWLNKLPVPVLLGLHHAYGVCQGHLHLYWMYLRCVEFCLVNFQCN